MQLAPRSGPELAKAAIIGGDRQRQHQNERGHTDRHIGPFDDVGPDAGECLDIENGPDGEMRDNDKEGADADGAAEAQKVEAGPFPQGRNEQDRDDEFQRIDAIGVFERLDRLGAHPACCRQIEEPAAPCGARDIDRPRRHPAQRFVEKAQHQ